MHTQAPTALQTAQTRALRTGTPHAASGKFRLTKTALTSFLLGLYFITPWLRWTRAGESAQAVIVDIPARRFYLFGMEFWPPDLPLLLGLLIFSAATLFFVTAYFGRVWCGFTCPQTVWTDLFFGVDRRIDQRFGRDSTLGQAIKSALHMLIAVLTAFTFTGYFIDITHLGGQLATGIAPATAYVSLGVLTFTTYVFAAHTRENICLHMCPWPRFQSALLDSETLVVTYQSWRGDPRARARVPLRPELLDIGNDGPPAAHSYLAGSDAYRGDCVDCGKCVSSCPTRIDIRDGLQLGCIGCGLCIDACNTVMDRLDRPHGLIKLGTEMPAEPSMATAKRTRPRILRIKPMMFASVMLVSGSAMAVALANRSNVDASLEHQRQPPFVKMSDGSIRNDYALRFTHRGDDIASVAVTVEGLPGAAVRLSTSDEPSPAFICNRRSLSERVMVTVPMHSAPQGRVPVTVVLTERTTNAPLARLETYFWGPGGAQ